MSGVGLGIGAGLLAIGIYGMGYERAKSNTHYLMADELRPKIEQVRNLRTAMDSLGSPSAIADDPDKIKQYDLLQTEYRRLRTPEVADMERRFNDHREAGKRAAQYSAGSALLGMAGAAFFAGNFPRARRE